MVYKQIFKKCPLWASQKLGERCDKIDDFIVPKDLGFENRN
jgi:hypothetical protein